MIAVTVTGNLGRDAEIKEGRTSFSIASTEKVKDDKVTTWVNCTLWGKRGESLAQYLTKGKKVCVTGTASLRSYTSQGEQKTSLDVKVDQLEFMGDGGAKPAQQAGPTRRGDDGDIPF